MQNNGIINTNNFDEENIVNVKNSLAAERDHGTSNRKVFTMVQDNSSCDVVIKVKSRKKCVQSLLK